jgi:hypothetical protein
MQTAHDVLAICFATRSMRFRDFALMTENTF